MIAIGLELITERGLSMTPGDTFSLAIHWNKQKIPASIGHDVYHLRGLILPGKRLAATGRFHHSSEDAGSFFFRETAPCLPVVPPGTIPKHLGAEIVFPERLLRADRLDRIACLQFIKKEGDCVQRLPFYFEPFSLRVIEPNKVFVDFPPSFLKHFQIFPR
ncbi:hypothetical protein BSNK01_16170 [Bacillaceae bacterium]